MFKKKKFSCTWALFILWLTLGFQREALGVLVPGPVIPITTSGDILTPVVVSGTAAGFVITCTDSNMDLVSSFANDGVTWSTPSLLTFSQLYTGVWVSVNSSGTMATFIGDPLSMGYSTAAPYGFFSTDQGFMWTTQTRIEMSSTVATPVVVGSRNTGFMATWRDTADNNPYSAFSVHGLLWLKVPITNTGTVNSAVMVAGSTVGFLTAWQDTSNNAFASFSSDDGLTWSAPVAITSTSDVASDVWVASRGLGFMAVWVSNVGNAYSSFSSNNGATWSPPSLIAMNTQINTDVSVSGNMAGFYVAGIALDSNAYASFSSNNGTTWLAPVSITTDNSVSGSNTGTAFGFVDVSAVGNSYMFTWLDVHGNAQSSFAGSGPPAILPPANLTGRQRKNNFGLQYELFNTLKWNASPSFNVAGYNIYKNGVLITSVNRFTLQYKQHNQKKGAETLYSVTAFDLMGNESTEIDVIIP